MCEKQLKKISTNNIQWILGVIAESNVNKQSAKRVEKSVCTLWNLKKSKTQDKTKTTKSIQKKQFEAIYLQTETFSISVFACEWASLVNVVANISNDWSHV